MESSLHSFAPPGDSPFPCINFNEHLMEQSLLFTDNLKELKNLRSQLYSAAEYFESNFVNYPLKPEYREMVKDYVIGSLVNTVDHVGLVSSKVTEQIDKEVDVLSETEFRVSCIEQRVRTCQALVDREVFHFPAFSTRHHKHYVLPEGETFADKAVPCLAETMRREGRLSQSPSESGLYSSTRSRTSSFRNIFSSSSFRWARSSQVTARLPLFLFLPESTMLSVSAASSPAPSPSADLSLRSISLSSRRTLSGSSTSWLRKPEGLRKSAGQSFRGGDWEWDEVDQSPSRSKRMLKNLLDRRTRGQGDGFP